MEKCVGQNPKEVGKMERQTHLICGKNYLDPDSCISDPVILFILLSYLKKNQGNHSNPKRFFFGGEVGGGGCESRNKTPGRMRGSVQRKGVGCWGGVFSRNQRCGKIQLCSC